MVKPAMADEDASSASLQGAQVALDAGAAPPRLKLLSALTDYRDYRQLWLSTVLTQIGQWMLQITLGWVMLSLTDSAYYVGLIGFASGLPFLMISIPAGVLIDMVDRRRLLIMCQVLALVIGFSLAVAVNLGLAQPWHLLLAAFLNGAALAVNNATRQTLVATFVPRDGLQNAIALMSAGQNMTRIAGPMMGGPLIAATGPAGALYVQAAFLLAALLNTMMLPGVRPLPNQALALRRNLVEGFSFIAQSPALTGLLILATVPMLLVFPYVQFLPVYARDILDVGAQGLGILMSAGGLGAVTGSLLVAGVQTMRRKGLFMLVTTTLYGFVIIVFAYSEWVPLSIAMLFTGSLIGSAYMSINNSLFHLNVTDEIRGRVLGVYMLTWGLMPLGALPMGALGARIGVPSAIAVGAALTSIITIFVAFRFKALREL